MALFEVVALSFATTHQASFCFHRQICDYITCKCATILTQVMELLKYFCDKSVDGRISQVLHVAGTIFQNVTFPSL